MKKIALLLVCLMVGISTSFAQKNGNSSIGFNLNYASETSFGIGARYQMTIANNFRIEPEFNFYFDKESTFYWDLSANVSYLIPIASDVTIYPLAGIGFMRSSTDADPSRISENGLLARVGAGVEFQVRPHLKLLLEPKYQYNNLEGWAKDTTNQFVITAGIAYTF